MTQEAMDGELRRLRRTGLLVQPQRTGPHRGAWSVSKLSTVTGNSVPGYEGWDGDQMSNAPAVTLFVDGGRWHSEVREWVPGPGPGDFRHEHESLSEAVDSVLDFFFGPIERMYPGELRRHREAVERRRPPDH